MRTHNRLRDRVRDVLDEADASSEAIVSRHVPDCENDAARTELLDAARKARDLLESTDPSSILAAIGVGTRPNGSEPASIPEAIARGEPDQLEELRRLLSLANLADQYDGCALERAVDDLRETMNEPDESVDATEAIEGERAEANPEERLRSAMQAAFSDVGDGGTQLRERLEAASSRLGTDDAIGSDETEPDGPYPGHRAHQDYGSTRYSTVAPSPSKRADMRGLARVSTLPDKRRD